VWGPQIWVFLAFKLPFLEGVELIFPHLGDISSERFLLLESSFKKSPLIGCAAGPHLGPIKYGG